MNADLTQLKDIHHPQAISMWPTAPGWITLLALLLITLCVTFYFWHQRTRNKYTVNFALAKLEKLSQLMIENPEKINIAAEISTLLRRTALYYFPRQDIAGLSGKHWLHFLNESGNTTNFTEDAGLLLTDAPYKKEFVRDLSPLFDLARAWLTAISKQKVISVEK